LLVALEQAAKAMLVAVALDWAIVLLAEAEVLALSELTDRLAQVEQVV
jgi:hypothetical protein